MKSKFKNEVQAEDEMKAAFKIFDKDGSGKIDAKELKNAMKSLGNQMSDKEVEEMLAVADLDADGKVDYNGMY
jgi:calmodulin